MEQLLAKHRKEQRDLQSKVTQKKKSASKKTRKGVNDECAALEEDLKARQEAEVAALTTESGDNQSTTQNEDNTPASDDDDLLASITSANQPTHTLEDSTANLNISPITPDTTDPDASSSQRKPNRQKARLARRAAEQDAAAAEAAREAANLPDLKAQERAKMIAEFSKRGLKEKVVAANGHCMYLAVADQMRELGLDLKPRVTVATLGKDNVGKMEDYKIVRGSAADYIAGNADDFVPFLEEPLEEYVRKIRETGEWGGQLELMALAKTYGVDINVLQGEGRLERIQGSGDAPSENEIWLAYYRHGFGLGEHYNSLRKAVVDEKS